jgi:hypothetical protein
MLCRKGMGMIQRLIRRARGARGWAAVHRRDSHAWCFGVLDARWPKAVPFLPSVYIYMYYIEEKS